MRGFQITTGGYHRPANKRTADFIALGLDSRAAFSSDSSGNATAKDQLSVGRVHYGVGFHLGYIAIEQFKNVSSYFHLHFSQYI